MHRFGLILCVLATFVAGLHPAAAQVRTDSLFSWQGYARAGRCHIRIFEPAPDLDRQSVIVIRELADNSGPTTVNDIAYLVEEVSRGFALAPDSALWIVHWGAFRFEAAPQKSKAEFATLNILGARDTIVAVDPAVTATADSDDTGVMALCRTGDLVTFGLQDASVHPDEVDGAPSSVWAPRAYWLALLWGASRIIVETNQGGDEVVSALHALLTRPPTEAHAADHLLGVLDLRSDEPRPSGFSATVRRLLVTAAHLKIETVSRRSDKPVRWGWYGDEASHGDRQRAALLADAGHGGPEVRKVKGHRDRAVSYTHLTLPTNREV